MPASWVEIFMGTAGSSAQSSNSARPGMSACSRQWTSGPRISAAVPRTASTRWCAVTSRGGMASTSATWSPARQARVTRRYPSWLPARTSDPFTVSRASAHQAGTRRLSVHGPGGDEVTVTAIRSSHGYRVDTATVRSPSEIVASPYR